MGLSYNGIDLSFTYTESISQVPVFDPSGTDQIGEDVTFKVRSILTDGSLLGPALPGDGPGAAMNRIRERLQRPRKRLRYTSPDGHVWADTSKDDNNGPTPGACTVTQVTEDSYIVSFEVTVRLASCPDLPGTKGYLSHRWTESTS